jgi:hypothetical protein
MKRDLSEMEHMIDEYLAFARGEGGEAVETVPAEDLIEEVSEGAVRAGAEVSVTAEPDLTASVRPNALKRALSNLIMNAAVHSEHIVVTAAARAGGGVEIVVDDDGPGIPRGPLRGSLQGLQPPRRVPQPERQGRGPGPRHRPRRGARPWRRRHAQPLADGSRHRQIAGLEPWFSRRLEVSRHSLDQRGETR